MPPTPTPDTRATLVLGPDDPFNVILHGQGARTGATIVIGHHRIVTGEKSHAGDMAALLRLMAATVDRRLDERANPEPEAADVAGLVDRLGPPTRGSVA